MNDRQSNPVAWLAQITGFGLAGEMIGRTFGLLNRSPTRATPFEAVASWSMPFLILGALLIFITHWTRSDARWRMTLGIIGHLVGFVFSINFFGTLIAGVVIGTTSGITAPPFLFLAAVHGVLVYHCVRRAKWSRVSSRDS